MARFKVEATWHLDGAEAMVRLLVQVRVRVPALGAPACGTSARAATGPEYAWQVRSTHDLVDPQLLAEHAVVRAAESLLETEHGAELERDSVVFVLATASDRIAIERHGDLLAHTAAIAGRAPLSGPDNPATPAQRALPSDG